MKIVTGYTGSPHITSNDQQGLNQGAFGVDSYVLNVGQKFEATLNTATTVTIEDGEGMMQGVHFRIDPGETEMVTISPGTPDYNRIDLICARYTKDSTTGVEAVELVVIEGTPSESTASEPAYNTGDIRMGDSLVDFPLYKVMLTGVSPELVKVASDAKTSLELEEMMNEFSDKFTYYEGTVENVAAFSIGTKQLTGPTTGKYVVISVMSTVVGLFSTAMTNENNSLTCSAIFDADGKLFVHVYNTENRAQDVSYRVVTMKI